METRHTCPPEYVQRRSRAARGAEEQGTAGGRGVGSSNSVVCTRTQRLRQRQHDRRPASILAPTGPAGAVGTATCVHASYLGPVQDGQATGASRPGLLRPPLLLFALSRALLHGGEEPEHRPAYVGNVLQRNHTSKARQGKRWQTKKMTSSPPAHRNAMYIGQPFRGSNTTYTWMTFGMYLQAKNTIQAKQGMAAQKNTELAHPAAHR